MSEVSVTGKGRRNWRTRFWAHERHRLLKRAIPFFLSRISSRTARSVIRSSGLIRALNTEPQPPKNAGKEPTNHKESYASKKPEAVARAYRLAKSETKALNRMLPKAVPSQVSSEGGLEHLQDPCKLGRRTARPREVCKQRTWRIFGKKCGDRSKAFCELIWDS